MTGCCLLVARCGVVSFVYLGISSWPALPLGATRRTRCARPRGARWRCARPSDRHRRAPRREITHSLSHSESDEATKDC
eukprot:4259524-Prymnesium_polylepis.1